MLPFLHLGKRKPEIADDTIGEDEKKTKIKIAVSVFHANAQFSSGNSLDRLRQHKPAKENTAVGDKGMVIKSAQPVTLQKIPYCPGTSASRTIDAGCDIEKTGKMGDFHKVHSNSAYSSKYKKNPTQSVQCTFHIKAPRVHIISIHFNIKI